MLWLGLEKCFVVMEGKFREDKIRRRISRAGRSGSFTEAADRADYEAMRTQ
jgi:hypothetical protein